VGAEVFHVDEHTDRYDEANSPFSQFCERAKKTMGEDAIMHSSCEHVTGAVATDKSDRVAAAELG